MIERLTGNMAPQPQMAPQPPAGGSPRFDFQRNDTQFENGQVNFNQGEMEDIMSALVAAIRGELEASQADEIIRNFIMIFGEAEFQVAKELILNLDSGGEVPDEGLVQGPGTGTSDDVDAIVMDDTGVPGMNMGGSVGYDRMYAHGGDIEDDQSGEPIKLSAGEYILPERAVRQLGNGNHGLGALKLDRMLGKEIRHG